MILPIKICPNRQKLLDCRGHALVTGGPGSGKTTIALKKAVTRINEGLLPGQSVLFISFSRAAVTRIVDASKIEVPKRQLELLSIQTFHSLFWDLIRAHGYLLGLRKRLKLLLPHDERALSAGAKEGDLLWGAWLARREEMCVKEGRVVFDQFAPLAARLLEKSSHLRELMGQRHPLIIVDEAQDTNTDAWRCIEALAPNAQLVCLADLDQQIFDYLPGVGPERMEAIQNALSPTLVELGIENMRSPNSEIAIFGRDLLSGTSRRAPYIGVAAMKYDPKKYTAETVRQALGRVAGCIKKTTGNPVTSIAILLGAGPSALKLSLLLSSAAKPIPHRLLFDEAEALLAARFAAFLLEPRESGQLTSHVAEALTLLAAIKRAAGVKDADILQAWAIKVRNGKLPAAGTVKALQKLMTSLDREAFTGDPARDWLRIKAALRESGEERLLSIVRHLDYVVAFKRGRRISDNLSAIWKQTGNYVNAREALEVALAQDQLIDGFDDRGGIQVMTIHKAKGKQFDGVIVVREPRYGPNKPTSSFVWRDDAPPYQRSRKILHVAVTRARVQTLILDPVWPACPILGAHKL